MQKVPKHATRRDQNLKVRDGRTVVTTFGSALLGLCQTAVLASWLLPFPMDMAVPQDPGFNIQCPSLTQKNTV